MILVLELLPVLFPRGIDLCCVLPLGAAVGRGPSTPSLSAPPTGDGLSAEARPCEPQVSLHLLFQLYILYIYIYFRWIFFQSHWEQCNLEVSSLGLPSDKVYLV